MFSRLVAPVANFLKTRAPQSTPEKGVPELLAALAEIRAKKAQLEREEVEIIAATRARLREQQAALEDLRRKVQDSGIDATEQAAALSAPSVPAAEVPALRPSEQVLLSN